MKLLQEFKEFAMKGNVLDMAIGIIIGGGFGKVVSSLVGDIIMPPIGLLIGGVNFADLSVTLNPSAVKDGAEAVTLNYGNFIQVCFDFLIVAFSIFLFIRLINRLSRLAKEKLSKNTEAAANTDAAASAPAAGPSQEALLLREIRDLLKTQSK